MRTGEVRLTHLRTTSAPLTSSVTAAGSPASRYFASTFDRSAANAWAAARSLLAVEYSDQLAVDAVRERNADYAPTMTSTLALALSVWIAGPATSLSLRRISMLRNVRAATATHPAPSTTTFCLRPAFCTRSITHRCRSSKLPSRTKVARRKASASSLDVVSASDGSSRSFWMYGSKDFEN